MKKSSVGIIMCTYNEVLSQISEAIDSILNQTFKDFYLFVVCDNPERDDISNLIKKYQKKDSRIELIQNKKNIGSSLSKNLVLNKIKCKYIAIMDADDISLPNRLEEEYNYLETHQKCDIVCCNQIQMNIKSETIKNNYTIKKIDSKQMKRILLFGCPITHSGIMCRKEVYDKCQGYRKLSANIDYDLYLRALSLKFNIEMIPKILVKYRINENNITNSNIFRSIMYSNYVRGLYLERIFLKKDSYSEKNLKKFELKMKINDKDLTVKRNKIWEKYQTLKKNILNIIKK